MFDLEANGQPLSLLRRRERRPPPSSAFPRPFSNFSVSLSHVSRPLRFPQPLFKCSPSPRGVPAPGRPPPPRSSRPANAPPRRDGGLQQSLRSAALFPADFCFSLRLRARSDRKRTGYIHIYTYTRADTPCRSLPPSAVPQRSRGPAPGGSWPYGTCGINGLPRRYRPGRSPLHPRRARSSGGCAAPLRPRNPCAARTAAARR